MESDQTRPLPVPKPRPFPINGVAPGPRCGQTLTAIAGPDGDLSKARLILFGGATALEGSSGKGDAPSSPGPAASGKFDLQYLKGKDLASQIWFLQLLASVLLGPQMTSTYLMCALANGRRWRHRGSPPHRGQHMQLRQLATWWSYRWATCR